MSTSKCETDVPVAIPHPQASSGTRESSRTSMHLCLCRASLPGTAEVALHPSAHRLRTPQKTLCLTRLCVRHCPVAMVAPNHIPVLKSLSITPIPATSTTTLIGAQGLGTHLRTTIHTVHGCATHSSKILIMEAARPCRAATTASR